jgi:predicted ATP-grasp superfamily ATP-dependent carboligase
MHVPETKVFVTDGDQRPALAIARSLGRRGVCVLVGAEQSVSLASSSKYCARQVVYPSPYRHSEAFDRFLLEFVERERVDVVVPVTDVTTHLVARNWHVLSRHSATASPPFEAFDLVANKWSLLQHASQCGIPIPRTHFVDGVAGLTALVAHIEYPAVVKPLRSRILTDAGWLNATVQYAHCESDLVRLYHDTEYLACYPSLIQERIVGPGIGVFVLCDHGRVRAAFAHRRLREKPPSGGVSVLCESVALDPELLDQAMRLLEPLGWHGVAMLEYKQDERTGRSFLMEVNGRFWGSLQLAVDAGVDFPYLAYQLALGQRLEIPHRYKIGVRSRWLLGDLDHLLLRLFHSTGEQHLPNCAPSRIRTLLDFLKFAGSGLHYDVVSLDDPLPFLHEVRQYAADLSISAAHIGRRLIALCSRPRVSTAATSNQFNEQERPRHVGALK